MINNQKGQINISFTWLFAIVIGIFILALAIYAAVKLTGTSETASSAKIGKEISVLLNPLETSFESSKTTILTMPQESRISNICNDNYKNFGLQSIEVSQKSFNKWQEITIDVGFQNKYIFSEKTIEGKDFLISSKSFDFPFKVADVIYLTSVNTNYCFVNASEDIERELIQLNQENLHTKDCPSNSINVCFQSRNCEINVDIYDNSVEKNGELVYYETDALLYGAVFADKEIYECQVSRLMQRLEEVSYLYDGKASILSDVGCSPEVNLIPLTNIAGSIQNSATLWFAEEIVKNADDDNDNARCRLW